MADERSETTSSLDERNDERNGGRPAEVRSEDDFSLWYRFKTTVIFNLLHVAGPASLDDAQNPRVQLEREYLRRKALHRARKSGGAVEELEPKAPSTGFDPFVLCVIGGIAAVAFLLVWFVIEAR